MNSYKNFVMSVIDVPVEEAEPICPFDTGVPIECNSAYSDACYGCRESLLDYRRRILGKQEDTDAIRNEITIAHRNARAADTLGLYQEASLWEDRETTLIDELKRKDKE